MFFLHYAEHISISLLYLLCFIFMFKKNTEHLCFILLLVLNVFLFIMLLSLKSPAKIFLLPQRFLDVQVSMNFLFIIPWVFIITANSQLVNTYRVIHKASESTGKTIKLGNNAVYKDNLKIFLIFSTISIGLIYISIFNYIQNEKYNSIVILIGIISLISSIISLYISNNLANRTELISKMSMNS
jgi:hypothetical protein